MSRNAKAKQAAADTPSAMVALLLAGVYRAAAAAQLSIARRGKEEFLSVRGEARIPSSPEGEDRGSTSALSTTSLRDRQYTASGKMPYYLCSVFVASLGGLAAM